MLRLCLLVLAILLLGAGCVPGRNTQSAYTVVLPSSINPGDTIPRPAQTPILTLQGAIPNSPLQLDRPTLQAMGVVSYTIQDPFAGRAVTYEGVLLSRLLDVVGADANASTLHIVALNDYEADLAVADVRRWPIMLAYAADGVTLGVVEKGPLRVVFPTHAYDIDPIMYEPLWVWQVALIEVRS